MNKKLNVQAAYIVTVDQAVTFDAEIAVATAKNERKRKVNSYKMTQGTDSGTIIISQYFRQKWRYRRHTRGIVSAKKYAG